MKGTVYTGIVYLPKHPDADMHGLLRCAVRTKASACSITRCSVAADLDGALNLPIVGGVTAVAE